MIEANKHISLPKNVDTKDDLDFSFLRKKGLEYIEQLSRNLWTDYNTHDPGITILEMLAYAITDLGARIEMPMENILASENAEKSIIEDQFFKAIDIFSSQPVTKSDYRKLFIDVEGVKNCWLMPYNKAVYVDCQNSKLSYNIDDFGGVHETFRKEFALQGLYSILVDFDDVYFDGLSSNKVKEKHKVSIIDEIKKRYHANRNLCEDVISVAKVNTHPIKVCATIELESEVDEEFIHAKVLRSIDEYFSPSLRFYSLKQMFEKGYTTDEIFEGPILENGFLDHEELETASLRTEVRLSDIMNLIMSIDGVKVIKGITIKDCNKLDDQDESWVICVEDGKKPFRCNFSVFNYYKSVLPVNINQDKLEVYQIELENKYRKEHEKARFDMEPDIPIGEFLNTGETTTIQNDFPDTYGIGPNGLPSHVENSRKAKAKQLKGYLLFFDQILASYFAHLGKVKDILSINSEMTESYYSQAVKDIKGFSDLVSKYPQDDDSKLGKLILSDSDNCVERKNKILDHLIARFAEKFNDYAFLMKQLYGAHSDRITLQTKEAFLKDYDQTSQKRGSAFNYYHQPKENLWNTDNVSGVQKRIARLVGIKDYTRRSLSESFAEIYSFDDLQGDKVYRWRIRNELDEIVLSATENYPNSRLAEKELNLLVVKILETTEEMINKIFYTDNDEQETIETIPDETLAGNLQIQVSESGKYSFNVVNQEVASYTAEWVVARQFSYYDSTQELKDAMLKLLRFIINVFSEEGMFLVEHILLRPDVTSELSLMDDFMPICEGDCESGKLIDPYSFRVTIILPGWGFRFANSDFRAFLETLIRKELPAHILARVCWVGYRKNQVPENENDMFNFEEAYQDFLSPKIKLTQQKKSEILTTLVDKVNRLTTIYGSGRLIDCGDEDEELKGKIILGRTNIGNI